MAADKITLVHPEIEKYADNYASWPNFLSDKIVSDTENELKYADMLSGNQVAGLLALLIRVSGAKKTAEIGMFTGFASLAMIEALPENGELYCLEMNARYIELAMNNLRKSNSFNKLKLLEGDARINMHHLPDDLDLIFIDADKEYYPDYYEVLFTKLRPGGIMVADNVFWHGGVLGNKDRKSLSIHEFNERVAADKRVENVMLTVRDGLMLIRKISG